MGSPIASRVVLCLALTAGLAETGHPALAAEERGLLHERAASRDQSFIPGVERRVQAVASNGLDYLAAWTEGGSIYVTAIRDGDSRPAPAIFIGRGSQASLKWTGGEYLILTSQGVVRELHRIASDGTYLGQAPLDQTLGVLGASLFAGNRGLAFLANDQQPPFDGISFLVDRNGRLTPTGIDARARLAAAPDGAGFLVAQSRASGTVFSRLGSDGKVGQNSSVPLPQPHSGTAIAAGGNRFLFVYSRDSRVEALLGDDSLSPIWPSVPLGSGFLPRVLWDGDSFVVSWLMDRQIVATRVSAEGRSAGSGPVTIGNRIPFEGASNGRSTLFVFSEGFENDYRTRLKAVFLERGESIDESLRTRSFATIGLALPEQRQPRVAIGSRSNLIVWREATESPQEFSIMAKVIPHGQDAQSRPEILLYRSESFSEAPLSVASDGNDFLVISIQRDGLVSRHISCDGVLSERTFKVAGYGYESALEWNGQSYLLVFRSGWELQSVRLDRDGLPMAPTIRLAAEGFAPKIRAVDGTWYVAWANYEPGCVVTCIASRRTPHGIFVGRVGPDGQLIEPLPLTAATAGIPPSLASNGKELVVTWIESGRTINDPRALKYRRLEPRGTWIDGGDRSFSLPVFPRLNAATLLWTGIKWRLVWTSLQSEEETLNSAEVFFSASGATLGSPEFLQPLVPPSAPEVRSFDTAASAGQTMIGYVRPALAPSAGPIPRVFYRSSNSPSPRRRAAR